MPCSLRLSQLLKQAGVWLCEGFGLLLASFCFFLWIIYSPLVGSWCLKGKKCTKAAALVEAYLFVQKVEAPWEREGELHHYLWVDPLSVETWETSVIWVSSAFGGLFLHPELGTAAPMDGVASMAGQVVPIIVTSWRPWGSRPAQPRVGEAAWGREVQGCCLGR